MMAGPLSLQFGASLPHRAELEAELSNGADWRRDERRHRAGDLAGTYRIRLGIAQDTSTKGGIDVEETEAVDNLKFLVSNLDADPERAVTAFFLRGAETLQYWIFEGEIDGTYLGSIVGTRRG